MKLNQIRQQSSQLISLMESEIIKCIDKICEENNYNISYTEINSALIRVLKSNNQYELKELYKEESEADQG